MFLKLFIKEKQQTAEYRDAELSPETQSQLPQEDC